MKKYSSILIFGLINIYIIPASAETLSKDCSLWSQSTVINGDVVVSKESYCESKKEHQLKIFLIDSSNQVKETYSEIFSDRDRGFTRVSFGDVTADGMPEIHITERCGASAYCGHSIYNLKSASLNKLMSANYSTYRIQDGYLVTETRSGSEVKTGNNTTTTVDLDHYIYDLNMSASNVGRVGQVLDNGIPENGRCVIYQENRQHFKNIRNNQKLHSICNALSNGLHQIVVENDG